MASRRVLLTGGTGFIGSRLAEALAAAGEEVHVVSSREDAVAPAGATLHVADLLDPEQRAAAVAAALPTDLAHLAWYLEPGQVWNSIENVRWVEASLGLLRDFAAGGGRRALIAGSCSEYGPDGGICDERTTVPRPSNLYGICKDALRAVALPAAARLGISLAWARIFFAYGPGEHPVRLVASVTRHLLAGEEAPCSHGHQQRDYLSTPQIAAALQALLASPVEGIVNVGSGARVELREIVTRLAELTGRPELVRFGAVTPPADDPPLLVAATRRLNEEVGWTPTQSLADGLAETVEWWRSRLALAGAPGASDA